MCECCGLNPVQVKDYRDFADQGWCPDESFQDFFVCYNCMSLNNYYFLKLLNAKFPIGKKRVIAKILDGKSWEKWLLKP
jgi:hypothetical protein